MTWDVGQNMQSKAALHKVRQIFAARNKPEDWLLPNLCAVDRIDGEEFIADVVAGAEPRTFFLSAIPYFDFLTVDAAIYLLPDLFSVIADDPTNLVTFLPSFTLAHGKEVFLSLSEGERISLHTLISALKDEADHHLTIAMLTEVEKVIDGKKTAIEQDIP